jgi:hypothetical protein
MSRSPNRICSANFISLARLSLNVTSFPSSHYPTVLFQSGSDLPGIRRALEGTRQLLEIYRRQLTQEKSRRRLQRLENRIMAVATELDRFVTGEK